MPRFVRRLCLVVLVGLAPAPGASAQRNRLVPVEDWTYSYLQRLQRRGYLLDLSPTALPYQQGEVVDALDALDTAALDPVARRWVALLQQALTPARTVPDEAVLGATFEAGATAANQRRRDVLRPVGDDLRAWSRAALCLYLEKAAWIAELGLQHDLYYEQDPDGLPATRRLATRSENAYVGFHSAFASVYLGRFSNHWGLPGEGAVLVSANPRSLDQINLRLGVPRLSLRSFAGELDSITEDGRYTGRALDDTVQVGSIRRYLSAHRLDWRPSRHVSLSLMEAVLYSAPNAGFSLKYLNPLHFLAFVVDSSPKNDENNGFLAGLLWVNVQRWTVHGQLLVDDVDLLGQGHEPASVAAVGSVTYAGLPLVDLGLQVELVTARTYNTQQPDGRYLYLLRGLGTQFSDYVQLGVFADVYALETVAGLRLSPYVRYLAQGERDLRQPFPTQDEAVGLILTGVVERTLRAGLQAYYQPVPWVWVRIDGGMNARGHVGHIQGRDDVRFVGEVAFGFRLTLDRPVALGWP